MLISTDQFFEGKGSFLKAADVKDGGIFVIEKFESIATKISPTSPILRLKGIENPLGLNKTNLTFLIEEFGNDERKWVGRRIKLVHAMAANPSNGNKMQKTLRLASVRK